MNLSSFFKAHQGWILLIFSSLLIFALTYFALVEVRNSDFTHSLLVSQALIEHQTVRLDAYQGEVDHAHHLDYNYRIDTVNGHYYYHFPLAPSVFSVPFVWAANLIGLDMAVHDQEYALIRLMSVISSVLVFGIIYKICSYYLDPVPSLLLSLILVLGSAIISTLGTGLWNMHFALLFIGLSLLLLARYDTGRSESINPWLLGFLLFCAFWSRPTVTPFIFLVFVYIFFRHRATFLRLVAASFLFLMLLVGWSWITFGQVLSDYYLPSRLAATNTFWEAFYGNALSPARGFLIYSPFFVLVFIGILVYFRDLKNYDLFWLGLIWFVLHYIAVSRKNQDWWGGHHYGPRLLVDGMPALILITIFVWRTISLHAHATTKILAVSSFATLGMVGIFINSYQGLYNPSTYQWNKRPNIDQNPEYLFDWKYPQFLASEESLRRRNLEHQEKRLNDYSVGDAIIYESDEAVFWDWYTPETGWRWTKGTSPGIVFKLGSDTLEAGKTYVLEILGTSIEAQTVGIALNETELGDMELPSFQGEMPAAQSLTFDPALLKENALNRLDFYIPGAITAESEEARTSGMAFVSLKIYPQAADSEGVHYFDSGFFESGFSSVEKGWRWTDGTSAAMMVPLGAIEANKNYAVELTSGSAGAQEVTVIVNSYNLGALNFEGFEPQSRTLTFNNRVLNENGLNRVRLLIPNAEVPDGDTRRLGLAFVSLKIYPVEE